MLELPPQFKQQFEEKIPQLRAQIQEKTQGILTFLAPLWAEFGPQITGAISAIKTRLKTKPAPTVGSLASSGDILGTQFRHILIVGLNKAELLIANEAVPLWSDGWQELLDDTLRKHLGLVFFAPRSLDSKPVPAIPFLMNEEDPENASQATPPILQGVALLDFCRMPAAAPNTLNILVAADCLFHWDVKDTYVMPTTATNWGRDVEAVLKGYPRTTKANVYTQWDISLLPQNDRISTHNLRSLPLESSTWLNEPTFQERYSWHALIAGLSVACLVWGGLWWQSQGLQTLTEQLDMVQQQIPRGGQFSDLERAVAEQERMFARRPLFALAVKDVQRAVAQSGLQIEQLEVKIPDVNAVPDSYIVTLSMPTDAYSGWLQQEPAARAFLLNSAMVHAVRKPPSTAGFKLEGLVMLAPWLREYNRLLPQLPSVNTPMLSSSPTSAAAPQREEEQE